MEIHLCQVSIQIHNTENTGKFIVNAHVFTVPVAYCLTIGPTSVPCPTVEQPDGCRNDIFPAPILAEQWGPCISLGRAASQNIGQDCVWGPASSSVNKR